LLRGLGWTLGARYYYGLVDVYKDIPGKKNSALYLKLMVPIGLSQKKKEEIKKIKDARDEKKAAKKAAKKEAKEDEKDRSFSANNETMMY
jgi:hypothetical protein